jgi:ATP-dependent DNA helicase RecG
VCPVIEDSEKLDVRSVAATYDDLTAGELSELRVGLLHGRLGPDEKEATMELYRRGRLDVLVATTVIEVGVDVPNATVMVILSADRFGIAQLHQLRGRVGRGEHASVCFAVSDAEVTPEAWERLEALVRTTDGFELAEVDLELRGEGTLFGGAQSGRNDLRLASLRTDRDWVERARRHAGALLAGDVALEAHPALAEELDWFVDRLTRDAAEGTDGADWLLKG